MATAEQTPDLAALQRAFEQYGAARAAFLAELGLPNSNRDPLAEFSERLIAAIVGGSLAPSRVQVGYDVESPTGEKIQVKYLANPPGRWVNEHPVKVTDLMDSYAIVFFESLLPMAAIVLPRVGLKAIGEALAKRHPKLESTLQVTQANYSRLISERSAFRALGVRLFFPPSWAEDTV